MSGDDLRFSVHSVWFCNLHPSWCTFFTAGKDNEQSQFYTVKSFILRLTNWKQDSTKLNKMKFSCYLLFLLFHLSLKLSYMLPRPFRFYLTHFIFCNVFLSVSILVFMPQNMLQGFYSAILCQCSEA